MSNSVRLIVASIRASLAAGGFFVPAGRFRLLWGERRRMGKSFCAFPFRSRRPVSAYYGACGNEWGKVFRFSVPSVPSVPLPYAYYGANGDEWGKVFRFSVPFRSVGPVAVRLLWGGR